MPHPAADSLQMGIADYGIILSLTAEVKINARIADE